jgi:hypothetical protein
MKNQEKKDFKIMSEKITDQLIVVSWRFYSERPLKLTSMNAQPREVAYGSMSRVFMLKKHST